jgi:uncharacterized damage-inducible protein DinB
VLQESLSVLITRDLRLIRRELEAYPDEASLWALPGGLRNSAGTLALHIAGNLQHYFGAVLGRSGYVRNREAEFARRNVPRAELLAEIDRAAAAVRSVLAALPTERLEGDYPEPIAGHRVKTGDYLMHMATHLVYHAGQLDAHRRAVTGQTEGVAAVSPKEIFSARPL